METTGGCPYLERAKRDDRLAKVVGRRLVQDGEGVPGDLDGAATFCGDGRHLLHRVLVGRLRCQHGDRRAGQHVVVVAELLEGRLELGACPLACRDIRAAV
jgi:hypothetical protein